MAQGSRRYKSSVGSAAQLHSSRQLLHQLPLLTQGGVRPFLLLAPAGPLGVGPLQQQLLVLLWLQAFSLSWGQSGDLALAQRLTLRLTMPDTPGVFPLLALGERSNLRCGVVLRSSRKLKAPALAPQSQQWAGSLDFSQDRQLRAKTPLAVRAADNTIPVALTGPAPKYTWGLNHRFYPYRDP